MNGHRQPPGQVMPQQDARTQQGGRRPYNNNQMTHTPYFNQQQHQQAYNNGFVQPYGAAYNQNPYGYQTNSMNNGVFYQQPYPSPHAFAPHFPNAGMGPQGHYASYPPPYGRTPVPQLNPTAHFIPAAAQPIQHHQASAQPSPVVSSTGYQRPFNNSQTPAQPPPRSSSQASVELSTPPISHKFEPPPSPEPKPNAEIFVPPLPWYPPSSRGAWPVKYTKKDQFTGRECHYVWASNPMETSRRGGLRRDSLDLFAGINEESSAGTTPITTSAENVGGAAWRKTELLEHSQSESSTNKLADEVVPEVGVELDSAPGDSQTELKGSDATTKAGKIQVEEQELPTQDNKERSRETSDESHTLSAESHTPSAISEVETDARTTVQDVLTPTHTPKEENVPEADDTTESNNKPSPPAPKARPGLWTGLFKSTTAAASAPATSSISSTAEVSSTPSSAVGNATSESLADALNSYAPGSNDKKVAFLKPRGLVNTGNICYMNSVLQVLVYCVPFYNFLDQLGRRSAHSFKNDTPLVEAMITFVREFKVIYSAESVEKVRLTLKDKDIELYGEQFTPNYIYEAMKNLPRFKTMERGRQQDAEEFLGFLLDGLHEECAQTMQSSSTNSSAMATPTNRPATPASESGQTERDGDWQQVGPKQKSAVTRSSGAIKTSSPITKIFGGTLRSEFRVPGRQNSITTQPFRTLPLEISSPQVNNVVEALKYLTRSETINGDFKGPRNATSGVKQFSIETLPQVLILHLKRFTYNKSGYTQKIGKKIGYPLELELPKEVFSRQQQQNMFKQGGLPKYRLIAVVYHHGKNASLGHYTVDVRRQDGREWIRLDDTVISRVRSEDVAEGGSEEDPKVLAAAAMAHKHDPSSSKNPFSGMDVDGDDEEDDSESKHEWRQVNGPSNSSGTGKSWSAVANGATTPKLATAPKSKAKKFSMSDRVAYLLFFKKV